MKNMNNRKSSKNTIKTGLKRALSGIIAFTFVLNLSPSAEFCDWLRRGIELTASAANKDTVPEGTVYSDEQARVNTYYDSDAGYYLLNNVDKVLDYSRAYYSYPNLHQNDAICINFGEGDSSSAINNYLAIGTYQCPFNGTIKLVTGSNNTLNIPEAFFDYIYDSATIISETTLQPSPLILTRTMDDSGEPVLARHVRHNNNGETKTWQIQLDSYDSTYNYSVGGFIGEMEDDAQIVLDIIDNTSCSTYGTDDIGYVCGKMGKDSSLTINTITNSNSSYGISTNAGNAGGVVGSMEERAELTLNCSMPNSAASITATGAGNYAGGIVGYNDGGSVNAPSFSSSNKYQILNTVSGIAGSGGVYGYYRPTFETNTSTLDISWLQIGTGTSARMSANGTGSVGGLFGVLVNEIKTTENETIIYSSGAIEVKDNSNNSAVIYLDHSDANNVSNYGGIIGTYTACDLSGTLKVTDVSVNVARSGGSYDNYGGAIGITEGGRGNETLDSLYVKFEDYNVTVASGNSTSASVYGGLVARSANAFIDANDVTCKSTANFYGGGVIGRMEDGVLRLSGTTDLTGGYAQISNAYYYEGQIVGGRDSSLVFAEYDSDYSRQWVLKRSTACSVDDIGSWGEVLRFDGISITEENSVVKSTEEKYGSDTVLTVDESAHTVTISAPAIQTTIGSIADYAMLSLCFQLKATDGLPVVFDSSWVYDYSDILSQDITLDSTFSLADTGLIGLTRDNAETASDSAAHCVYKGKFDGGNNTLTLATGEAYGQRGSTVLTDHNTTQGNGRIYRHLYNGMFGIVDGDYDATTNYTVKNLTLSGTIDVSARKVGEDKLTLVYCGGYAARALQDFTATNVNTETSTAGSETSTGFRMSQGGDCKLYMGRLVGEMGSAIDIISIASSEFGGSISGDNSNGDSCFGGVIGKIGHDSDEARTWNFNTVTLKGSVKNSSAKGEQRIGGLVAEIDGDYNNNSYHRMLTLSGITADGLKVTGAINSAGASGGLLGYSWLKTDVVMTDVTVKNNATVDIGTVAGNAAGIVYRATGHWTVTKLDIQSLKMTATNASSVGAIVNNGYFYSGSGTTFYTAKNSSALYLELPNNYIYNLVFSGESINSSAVFDELCVYTCPGEAYIMKNGNGVISIHSDLYTDGSTASGTYHAQTSYGAKPNPNARYYYNLDTVTAASSSDSVFTYNASTNANAYKNQLMSWGVNNYACKNLKQYFADPFNGTIADQEYDMSGYSWYPIDLDSSITVNGTFKFYNKEFEDSEKAKYNAESSNAYKRTSLYDSAKSSNTQHYLMQNGLFHDVNSCTMTIGNVILAGDIAGYAVTEANTTDYSASVCGALVCGTVSGSSSSKVGTIKMSTDDNAGISLAGIKVYNIETAHDNALKVSEYAPLLINKLGSHSALNLSKVSTTTGYNYDSDNDNDPDSSYISATSLIGDAGNSAASDVNIEFKLITLDGRNATGADDADLNNTAKGNFFAMYHTYNSIFSKATLLNSFSFDSGSSGVYNFTWKNDWDVNGDDSADSPHNGKVTYGKELGYDSINYPKTGAVSPYYNSQYPDEEFMYSGDSGKYTDPIDGNATTQSYDKFTSYFIPYVATKYDEAHKLYQLQVNHASKEIDGCGTYNDPYIIYTVTDLINVCDWINNGGFSGGTEIRVPSSSLTISGGKVTYVGGTWCDDHVAFTENNGSFSGTVNSDSVTMSFDVMRQYLAGAYYKISDSATAENLIIDSSSAFDGLGKSDYNEYRFRGVIDGNKKTIVNRTSAPFIYYSNGSVVKDLTISVDADLSFSRSYNSKTFNTETYPSANAPAYGIVFGEVLGGDNIIDNVSVGFVNNSHTITMAKADRNQLIPVGGYVGVVVNGGVIFRNMYDVSSESKNDKIFQYVTFSIKDGTNDTQTNPLSDSNQRWLYINPIIGRVINGFAVTESDAYRPYENGKRTFGDGSSVSDSNGSVTMQNGTKNYSIADINAIETNGTKDKKLVISGNAVTVSGGQDLFLMSLIINSGMDKQLLGYNQEYQASRRAKYTDVGTSETNSSNCFDYNSYAKNDYIQSTNKTKNDYGYLKAAYLNTTGTNLANNSNLTIKLTADAILPDGFKGFGNLYQKDDTYRIKVKEIDGDGHTISQNTSYYYHITDIYVKDKTTNYRPYADVSSGLGLINFMNMSCTFKNLYLKGNVKTDIITINSSTLTPTNKSSDRDSGGYLCAGMLIGTVNEAPTLINVALTNVDVHGIRNTGGMIGFIQNSKTLNYTIENTVASTAYNSDIIKVYGRGCTGGLVGKINPGFVKVDLCNHTFNLSEVVCESTERGGNYYDFGIGGFIGVIRGGVTGKDLQANYFKRIVIGTESKAQTVKCEDAEIFTAGVVGIMNKCKGITIEDCTFYNLSVKTKLAAAGLVAFPTTWTPAKVSNTHLYSPLGSTIESTTDYAGGLIGSSDPRPFDTNGSHTFEFDKCSVDNYTISGKKGAGGVIGFRGAYEDSIYLSVNNSSVTNCTIKSDGAAGGLIGEMLSPVIGYNLLAQNIDIDGYANDNPEYTGYICGLVTDNSANVIYKTNGNIKDKTHDPTNDITGRNPFIKMTGFSRQNTQNTITMTEAVVGSGGYGTNGYVIFADYTGACLNNDYSTTLSNFTNTSAYDRAIASPYVTVTDKEFIDRTHFLTGDAMGYNTSIAYANSRIGSILTAASGGIDPKRYSTAYAKIGAAATTNLISKLNTYGKYASYQTQMGSKAGTTADFPVLVLDDATDTTTTALINNYLRYLSNTDFDFAAVRYSDGTTSASDVFNVEIGSCVWENGSFVYHSGSYDENSNEDGAYLYKRNSMFSIADANRNVIYDNETGNRFTLIDVQFKDPSDPSKIAYHLYVPVLAKKMLYYDFHISFLSGTNYRVAPYAAKSGNTLIDNIDNPVTLEAQWTYDRDLAGWQTALESGDDFYHTSFEKRLRALNHNNGIPEGTKMVLVDANNRNAHYYADQGDTGLWTASGSFYKFDFSAFDGFTDPTLNDYFEVTAVDATDDTVVRFKTVDSADDAIISDGTNFYAIDANGDYELTLSYKDTVTTTGDSANGKDGKIQDDYYITFFTDSTQTTQDLYHLEFSDWGTFDNDTYPTLASQNDHTHILTGDIFVNDNFNISNLKSNTKMSLESGSDYNDTIQATFSVDVGINEDVKSNVNTYFGMPTVEVYQSFLIMLNRQNLTSSLQGIATRPSSISVTGFTIKHGNTTDYTIDTDPSTYGGMTDPDTLTTSNHIELRGNKDLRTYMKTACGTAGLTYSISATWKLSYADATKMAAQFPTRDTSNINNPSIGTLIGGSSNMSSTPESAVYSKNVAKLEDNSHNEITWKSDYSYYCTINTNAVLTLNSDDADNENGEFYQLGINANDIDEDDLTEDGYVPMKLNAVYDVSDLSAADTVKSMKLTFTVSKKPNYGTALPTFAEYIAGLKVYSYDEGDEETEASYSPLASGTGISIDTSNTAQVVYVVDNPDEVFDYDSGSKVYQIPVKFNAIIGSDFGNSKQYANYMIRLEVQMYTKTYSAEGWNTSQIDGSNDDDHVIYTHAKLITSVIE